MNAHTSRAPGAGPLRWAARLVGLLSLLAAFSGRAANPSLRADHDAYYPEEDILISFADGPGNPRDWVGLYPIDAVPGPTPSTRWYYVNGSQTSGAGLREGTLTFAGGLTLGGDWAAYLLLNDGYTLLATNLFKVVDPGSPLVRPSQRVYATGQTIDVTFTNGPANPKDWVGIYKQGQTPGPVASTLWAYVGGTQTAGAGLANGTVSFAAGLAEAGDYVALFLLNDGYDILASETFRVAAPTGAGPRLLAVNPSDGSSNQPPVLRFSATLTNGTAAVVPAGVGLKLDGVAVVPTITQSNGITTVIYTDASLPAAGSTHAWSLTVKDTGIPPNQVQAEVRSTVGAYRNIVLPAPLYFENFDAVAEGSLPAGWKGVSYTEVTNPDEDLGNLDSATYARWTVVAADRFTGSFVTYSNPDSHETDYQRVLTGNPFNVLDGKVYTQPLAQGRFLFGDSGYRNGRSQVLYVTTPDYDLTGKTNVHLSFKSLWEQNQDSIATVEYSIDQGATWRPIAYYLNAGDVLTKTNELTGAVSVDVEATFNTEYSDVARYTDEQGNELGGTYGAFVGAPITDALAPYVSARIDDNPSESKRIELYPLPAADKQSKVRIRFGHAGTDSWYFGIDDFGLYALTASSGTPPSLTVTRSGASLVISWPATAGAVLEQSPTLSPASWTAVTGVAGNQHTVDPSAAAQYFRLRQ